MTSRGTGQQKLYKACEQFVLGVYRSLERYPAKLEKFVNLFHKKKKSNHTVFQSQMDLVELIRDYPDLVEQLNKMLPDDFRIKKVRTQEFHREEKIEMDINQLLADLNTRNPGKVQELIKLIKEVKNNKSNENLNEDKLKHILHDEPDLLQLFLKQYRNKNEDNNHMEEQEAINDNSNSMAHYGDYDEEEFVRNRPGRIPRGQRQRVLKVNKRSKRMPEYEGGIQQNNVREPVSTTLPPTIRNELYLFEYLQTNLSPQSYEEFIKVIYLYTECVISASEVMILTKHLFAGNENYFNFFQEIIFSREITRRKNTTFFKPLNEIDFKKLNCERNGSYTRLPSNMPIMKCPPNAKNPISTQVLNTTWVSVPHGSEVNFVVNSKNSYEENLFKCEDERYEFDNTIYAYTSSIKWLRGMDSMNSEEKIQEVVDRILRLKVIQRVYANNLEIIEHFRKTPQKIAKILADRIETKLKDVKDTKINQAKQKWHESSEQNFHRSLDHRSFYFKQHEKKLTSHKNFLTDSLNRHKSIHSKDNTLLRDRIWGLLNTFEGISNGVHCNHPELDHRVFEKELSGHDANKKIWPIYRLTFNQKNISQDIYDILCLRLQTFHVNMSDREKITRYLRIFMFELMKFDYQTNYSKYDTVLDDKTVLNVVSRIESKIYDESFSFNTSKIEEIKKVTSEETISSALEKARQSNPDKMRDEDEEQKGNHKSKHDHNTENASIQKPEEENTGKNNKNTESLEDELVRLDSGSEEPLNVKEMEYIDGEAENQTVFVPSVKKDTIMFYGTQQIYFLVRFYYTLYERFMKAYEISHEFEDNNKNSQLSEDEKKSLANDRYETFKWILVHLIRGNIENEKYEDFLRSIFGTKAYLMFYIDKIIQTIIITIQKMANDEISPKVLNLFTQTDLQSKHPERNDKNIERKKHWPEHVFLAQLNNLTLANMNCLQNTHFFRFLYDPKSQLMTISLYESPYKDWNDKLLQSVFAYSEPYFIAAPLGNCEKHSINSVFLRRNKIRNIKKNGKKAPKVLQINNIEWKYIPNTTKLVTSSFDKEDIIQVIKKKKKTKEDLLREVAQNIKRIKRFRAWHKNALPNLSKQ